LVDEVKDNVKLKELPSDINIPVYKLDYINNIFEFVDTIFNLKNNPSPLDGVVDIISGPFEKIIGGKISWYYNGYLIYGEERDFNKNDEFYFEGNKFHFKIHDIVVVGEINNSTIEIEKIKEFIKSIYKAHKNYFGEEYDEHNFKRKVEEIE